MSKQVNEIGERVEVNYGENLKIGMPIFMDDINATGKAEDIRKGIRDWKKMEEKRKFTYRKDKTKYLVMNSGSLGDEEIKDSIEVGTVERRNSIQILGMTVDEEGNLKDNIKEMEKKIISKIKERNISNRCSVPGDSWESPNVRLHQSQSTSV